MRTPLMLAALLLMAYSNTATGAVVSETVRSRAPAVRRSVPTRISHRSPVARAHAMVFDPSTGLLVPVAAPRRTEHSSPRAVASERRRITMRLDPATGLLRPPRGQSPVRCACTTPTRLDLAMGLMVPTPLSELDAP